MERWAYLIILPLGCGPAVVTPADTDSGTTTSAETDDDSVGPTSMTSVGPTTIADTTGDPPPPPSSNAVDILFVIDNSGTMGVEQGRLATAGAALIAELDARALDWRIGFTTTDNGNPWCGSTGPEAGKLQLSSCRARTGEFVFNGAPPADDTEVACLDVCSTDVINVLSTPTSLDPNPLPRPWLERTGGVANVEIDPAEAFACAAPQGIAGCGFESPLESMYKSFLRAQNSDEESYGFLRDDAVLLTVIVTDEADCSYNNEYQSIFLPEADGGNPAVFWSDPDAAAPTSAVCWNAGVACDGGPEVYDSCRAVNRDTSGTTGVTDDQAVLQPLSRYVDFMQDLEVGKQQLDPAQQVLVAVIGGVPVGYETGEVDIVYANAVDPEEWSSYGIGAVCGSADEPTRAVPAVREREVAEAFATDGQRNLWSICEDSYAGAIGDITAMLVSHTGG